MRMNSIYTRSGDTGTTGAYSGERLSKASPLFEAIGCLDELSASIGVCISLGGNRQLLIVLKQLQYDLFTIGAYIADTSGEMPVISQMRIVTLENQIDKWRAATPPLTRFVLPGGTPLASALHVSRTIARRAERSLITYNETRALPSEILRYCNRLSDYLFAAARAANAQANVRESLWISKDA